MVGNDGVAGLTMRATDSRGDVGNSQNTRRGKLCPEIRPRYSSYATSVGRGISRRSIKEMDSECPSPERRRATALVRRLQSTEEVETVLAMRVVVLVRICNVYAVGLIDSRKLTWLAWSGRSSLWLTTTGF